MSGMILIKDGLKFLKSSSAEEWDDLTGRIRENTIVKNEREEKPT